MISPKSSRKSRTRQKPQVAADNQIKLYIKEIKHINRESSSNRSLYEEETTKIRFDFYHKVTKGEYVVALGHNNDDCIENIFTNIMKEKNYDNLNGMKFSSSENDVNIIRPMLDISKNSIYRLANATPNEISL